MDTTRIDRLNTALILLTCAAAHAFPYHLLILSYAILGPAHYLTQISWLHDKRYFSSTRYAPGALLLLTLLLLLFPRPASAGVILSLAIGVALVAAVPARTGWRLGAAAFTVALAWMVVRFGPMALFIALLLPTVLHVFVFTASFMWAGALKNGRAGAYVPLAALLIGAASFLIPAAAPAPDLQGLSFFRSVVTYLQNLLPLSGTAETRLFGFLSFAYAYHYLNWFSKAEVIRWHRIPKRRAWMIAAVYALSLAVYAYDYATGFMLLLFLSLLHVLLEFPLNLRTFAMIGSHLAASARGAPRQAGR